MPVFTFGKMSADTENRAAGDTRGDLKGKETRNCGITKKRQKRRTSMTKL